MEDPVLRDSQCRCGHQACVTCSCAFLLTSNLFSYALLTTVIFLRFGFMFPYVERWWSGLHNTTPPSGSGVLDTLYNNYQEERASCTYFIVTTVSHLFKD